MKQKGELGLGRKRSRGVPLPDIPGLETQQRRRPDLSVELEEERDPLLYQNIVTKAKWVKVDFPGRRPEKVKQEFRVSTTVISEHDPIVFRPDLSIGKIHIRAETDKRMTAALINAGMNASEPSYPQIPRGAGFHIEGANAYEKTDKYDPFAFLGNIYETSVAFAGQHLPVIMQYVGMLSGKLKPTEGTTPDERKFPPFTGDIILAGQIEVTRYDDENNPIPKTDRRLYAVNADWKEQLQAGLQGFEERTKPLKAWERYVYALKKYESDITTLKRRQTDDSKKEQFDAFLKNCKQYIEHVDLFEKRVKTVKGELATMGDLPRAAILIDQYPSIKIHLAEAFKRIKSMRTFIETMQVEQPQLDLPEPPPDPSKPTVTADAAAPVPQTEPAPVSVNGVDTDIDTIFDSALDAAMTEGEYVSRELFLNTVRESTSYRRLLDERIDIIKNHEVEDAFLAQPNGPKLTAEAERVAVALVNILTTDDFRAAVRRAESSTESHVSLPEQVFAEYEQLPSLQGRASELIQAIDSLLDDIRAPEPQTEGDAEPADSLPDLSSLPEVIDVEPPVASTPIEPTAATTSEAEPPATVAETEAAPEPRPPAREEIEPTPATRGPVAALKELRRVFGTLLTGSPEVKFNKDKTKQLEQIESIIRSLEKQWSQLPEDAERRRHVLYYSLEQLETALHRALDIEASNQAHPKGKGFDAYKKQEMSTIEARLQQEQIAAFEAFKRDLEYIYRHLAQSLHSLQKVSFSSPQPTEAELEIIVNIEAAFQQAMISLDQLRVIWAQLPVQLSERKKVLPSSEIKDPALRGLLNYVASVPSDPQGDGYWDKYIGDLQSSTEKIPHYRVAELWRKEAERFERLKLQLSDIMHQFETATPERIGVLWKELSELTKQSQELWNNLVNDQHGVPQESFRAWVVDSGPSTPAQKTFYQNLIARYRNPQTLWEDYLTREVNPRVDAAGVPTAQERQLIQEVRSFQGIVQDLRNILYHQTALPRIKSDGGGNSNEGSGGDQGSADGGKKGRNKKKNKGGGQPNGGGGGRGRGRGKP